MIICSVVGLHVMVLYHPGLNGSLQVHDKVHEGERTQIGSVEVAGGEGWIFLPKLNLIL